MRAYVFTDPALAKHAGQFVWLSIDTEKTGNAEFLRKYPIKAWPSFKAAAELLERARQLADLVPPSRATEVAAQAAAPVEDRP